MNSLRFLSLSVSCSLAALAVVLSAPAARALGTMISIDEFNSGAQLLDLSGAPGGFLNETATGGASILGGTRDLTYIISNPLSAGAQTSVHSTAAGMFSMNQGQDVEGITILRYDAGGTGLDGVNLTASGDNSLVISFDLANAAVAIGVSLVDTTGREATLDTTLPGPIAAATLLTLPFQTFSNPSGADFSSVDSLTFQFAPQIPGGDLAISSLGLTGVPSVVPEPNAVFLVTLTFSGIAFRRSRAASCSG